MLRIFPKKDRTHEALMKMKRNLKRSRSVLEGCKFVEDEAAGEGKEADKKREELMEKDAVAVIVKAMDKHKNLEEVQCRALSALWKLSRNDALERKFFEVNAAESIINAMNTFQHNESIQHYGCATLWNISFNDDYKKILIDIGVIKVIKQAMTNAPGNQGVQECGCGVIWSLSISKQLRDKFVDENIIERILVAMDMHTLSQNVQYYASAALRNLSSDDKYKLLIMTLDRSDALTRVFINHDSNENILLVCCGVVKNLSSNQENQTKLKEKGLVAKVINAMNNFKMNQIIQENGCGILRNLTMNDENMPSLLLNHNIETVVTNAIFNHKDDDKVTKQACAVFVNIFPNSSNLRLMKNVTNIKEDIQYVMNKFPQSKTQMGGRITTVKIAGEHILKVIDEYEKAVEKEEQKKRLEAEERYANKLVKILHMKKEIEANENEMSSLEIMIGETRAELGRGRKTLSLNEMATMENKVSECEANLRELKIDRDDLVSALNEECFDENGDCLFPEHVIAGDKDSSNGSSSQSNKAFNKKGGNLIRIPQALRIRSERCKLMDRIGDGGFSSVFRMKLKKKEQIEEEVVAFKQFMLATNNMQESEQKVIQEEIELLSQLKHENIVKILGAIGDQYAKDATGQRMGVGIVMECCENGSLRLLLNGKNLNTDSMIENSPAQEVRGNISKEKDVLTIGFIIHLLLGAARGLEYLHHHEPNGIIHGDIKSDNILVDRGYNAKICDFGISRLLQSSMGSTSAKGNMAGTIAYKAPESFHQPSVLKSDVYSFGCVMLEMLTGERPWSELGNDVAQIMCKVLNLKEKHDTSKVRKDAPAELVNIMNACLDYDINNRPAIREVKKRLETIVNPSILVKLDEDKQEFQSVENLFFPGGDREGTLTRDRYRIVRIDKILNRLIEQVYSAESQRVDSMAMKSNGGDNMLSLGSATSISTSGSDNPISPEVEPNERLLFHGTSQTDPMTILNNPDGFIKDYAREGFYGRGLYFAELARYSNTGFKYTIPNTNKNQMLVCSVACGKSLTFGSTVSSSTKKYSHKDLGAQHQSVYAGPHKPGDSGPGEDDSCMYIVYKESQVAPRYLITYEMI